MGWGYCGKNSQTGQHMGYTVPCKCHKRGCPERIDRGLSYVCGGMHEGDLYGCGYYFCENHLNIVSDGSEYHQLCEKCAEYFQEVFQENMRDERALGDKLESESIHAY